MAKRTLTARVTELEREVDELLLLIAALIVSRDRKRITKELLAAVHAYADTPNDERRTAAFKAIRHELRDT